MTGTPMVKAERESFFSTWMRAIMKPSESTYSAIAESPRARTGTAALWVFVCSFAPALVSILVSGGQLTAALEQAGVDVEQFGGGLGAALLNFLCITPIAAVVGVASFLISTALMQWVARMFGGKGNYAQMAYTLAAITAPAMLVSALLTLPSAIPFLGLLVVGLGGLFSLYVLVLNVMAVKGVQRFGWGAAIGSYFLPGLAIALVCCCVLLVLVSITGLALGDVWSTINQSLIQ